MDESSSNTSYYLMEIKVGDDRYALVAVAPRAPQPRLPPVCLQVATVLRWYESWAGGFSGLAGPYKQRAPAAASLPQPRPCNHHREAVLSVARLLTGAPPSSLAGSLSPAFGAFCSPPSALASCLMRSE